MVTCSDADDARYDSVSKRETRSLKSGQMGAKFPVQPLNFDSLRKGALMGAHELIEHNKLFIFNK